MFSNRSLGKKSRECSGTSWPEKDEMNATEKGKVIFSSRSPTRRFTLLPPWQRSLLRWLPREVVPFLLFPLPPSARTQPSLGPSFTKAGGLSWCFSLALRCPILLPSPIQLTLSGGHLRSDAEGGGGPGGEDLPGGEHCHSQGSC